MGYFPKNVQVELPSRHLGLIPDVEMDDLEEKFAILGEQAKKTIRFDRLLEKVDRESVKLSSPFKLQNTTPLTIAYALDDAFHFYYEDNLDLLRSFNVNLIPFSPLHDERLPEADAYYFGGGYPELFANELSNNRSFRKSVLEAHQKGIPIYAECGGLMYLGKNLEIEDQFFKMVGVFDGTSVMTNGLKRFGYCFATTNEDSLFGPSGTEVRGHEFHHSIFNTSEKTVLDLRKERDGEVVSNWTGGYQKGRTFASYLHVHFYQKEQLLMSWIDYILESK